MHARHLINTHDRHLAFMQTMPLGSHASMTLGYDALAYAVATFHIIIYGSSWSNIRICFNVSSIIYPSG